MKKIINSVLGKIIVTTLIVIGFSGCVIVSVSDLNSVTARGAAETYELKVGDYNAIKAEGYCDIRYYNAGSAGVSPDTVVLSVSPNVREYYVVEVIDGELLVRTTRKISFNSKNTPVLKVYTPVLNRLTLDGAFTFTAHDKITANLLTLTINGAGSGKAELDVNSLSASISGAGDFKLSGKADTAQFKLSGAGDLDALSLATREARVNLSGAGSVKLSCSESLYINASGVGSVEYRGSPVLDLKKDGLVSIKKLN